MGMATASPLFLSRPHHSSSKRECSFHARNCLRRVLLSAASPVPPFSIDSMGCRLAARVAKSFLTARGDAVVQLWSVA